MSCFDPPEVMFSSPFYIVPIFGSDIVDVWDVLTIDDVLERDDVLKNEYSG